jgi:2,4-dienoyl-CoA reductase-like NADH-dependent reductase (Old Yellow Enzyme family)
MQTLLFEPLPLQGLTLRNRVVTSPMQSYCATHGEANDEHVTHYGRFALGGAGLVFVESTKVDPRGCSTQQDLGAWKDAFVAGLARIAASIHAGGAAAGLQLAHSGRKGRRSLPWHGNKPLPAQEGVEPGQPWDLVGPSAVAHADDYEPPVALSVRGIEQLLDAWAAAAARAHDAGFDVLELHAGHGYLIHQFLSPVANRREDAWGGARENRMRFAVEVARRVRTEWPAGKPLFVRLSCVDGAGWDIEDSIALASKLRDEGVDVIDCSAGGMIDRPARTAPLGYGYQVEHARRIRAATGILTMAVGLIVHPAQAAEIVDSGSADLVALGREMLHHPNWALDAAQKLGHPRAFEMVPRRIGFWLDGRRRPGNILPSTWQPPPTS